MTSLQRRLDKALHEAYPNLSRSHVQKLIVSGYVSLNGRAITKPAAKVGPDDALMLDSAAFAEPEVPSELPVLYEDENVAVVNKPAGLLTHSKGAFNPEPTLESWIKSRPGYRFAKDERRGGIVHRLDRATSGVVIGAKNRPALAYLQKQFQSRKVKKTYLARVSGDLRPSHAIVDLPIERHPKKPQTFRVGAGGRAAVTEYRVQKNLPPADSLVELRPVTGRTHQLRVHLHYLGHPIVGDTLYRGRPAPRLMLHAASLEITLPGGERKTFFAPLPKGFEA